MATTKKRATEGGGEEVRTPREMEMEMEGEVVLRNQPRRSKKNRADLADELEFFMELRDALKKKKKKKEKGMSEKERFDPSSSYCSLGTHSIGSGSNWPSEQICDQTEITRRIKPDHHQIKKQLGFVVNHINILRKRLRITGIADSSPVILDPTDRPLEKHANDDFKDLRSLFQLDPAVSDDDDDANGCGAEEEDEEIMDWGKSKMEGQAHPRIDSKLKSEMEAEAIVGLTNEASIFIKSEKSLLKPDPIPTTNIMAKVEGDDPIHSDDVMPRDDDHGAAPAADEMDRGSKIDTQLAAMAARPLPAEEQEFAWYRSGWEAAWGKRSSYFPDMTTVSSMQFTHMAPGRIPFGAGPGPALQIFSFKFEEIKGGFTLPLSVYGVIAVRDVVDRNRNLLFSCDRSESQQLTQDDPFLHLIGPSRAVVWGDHVEFEVQLRAKGSTKSLDRALITATCHYFWDRLGVSTIHFNNCFCTTELRLELLLGSVQATILSVRAIGEASSPWPFGHGARVACSPVSRKLVFTTTDTDEIKYIPKPSSGEIVLLDSRDGTRHEGGYLHLSRQVVSVQVNGQLEVEIQAYAPSGGGIAAQGQVCLAAQDCNVSQGRCRLGSDGGGAEVEVTVAWSFLAPDMHLVAATGWEFEHGDDDSECVFR